MLLLLLLPTVSDNERIDTVARAFRKFFLYTHPKLAASGAIVGDWLHTRVASDAEPAAARVSGMAGTCQKTGPAEYSPAHIAPEVGGVINATISTLIVPKTWQKGRASQPVRN
jgi:hypothetical protein